MNNGMRAKFEENLTLEFLEATDDCVLIKANPSDTYWGVELSIHNSDIQDINK